MARIDACVCLAGDGLAPGPEHPLKSRDRPQHPPQHHNPDKPDTRYERVMLDSAPDVTYTDYKRLKEALLIFYNPNRRFNEVIK